MEILKFHLDTLSRAYPYVSEVLKGGKTFSITFPEGSYSALIIQQSADGTKWQSKQSVSPTNKATVNVPADSTIYLRVLVSVRPQSASYKDYSGGGGGGIDTEVDPTVPSWAKQPEKPTYTAEEVGAAPKSELDTLSREVVRNEQSWGHYTERENITLVAKEDGFAISKDGSKVTKAGWAIAEFTAIKGNTYLFNPGTMDGNVCLFAEKVEKQETRNIDYTWTYGEDGLPIKVEATYNEVHHSYTISHDEELDVDVYVDEQTGDTLYQLPLTYIATIGSYNPMTVLNADAELPADGYCRFVSHFHSDVSLTIAVSFNKADADLAMKVLRDGNTASICTQLSNISKRVSSVTERVEVSLEGIDEILKTI